MNRILFVDDDRDYSLFMKELLELQGYRVDIANSAIEGIKIFKDQIFDLVITDLQMASVDGFQFFSLVREITNDIKVIILTNSDSDEDEYRGLDLSINEYIKKKVSLKILIKRIKKVLEEDVVPPVEELYSSIEKLYVQINSKKVYQNEVLVSLTLKEFELLVLFLKNKNIILSREKIIKEIWKSDVQIVDTRIIDTHIKHLRAKLYLTSIYSIRGVGYEWTE